MTERERLRADIDTACRIAADYWERATEQARENEARIRLLNEQLAAME